MEIQAHDTGVADKCASHGTTRASIIGDTHSELFRALHYERPTLVYQRKASREIILNAQISSSKHPAKR